MPDTCEVCGLKLIDVVGCPVQKWNGAGIIEIAQRLNIPLHRAIDAALWHARQDQSEKVKALREALRKLLWPHVPSGDDVAMLVAGMGGSVKTRSEAMGLADNLRHAQAEGRAALAACEKGGEG